MANKAKNDTVTAYKGTTKDMQCQRFQYELGKEYEHKGRLKLCEGGFHACENPLDVLAYYPMADGNRFFQVEQSGAMEDDGHKRCSTQIRFKAELKLQAFLKAAVDFVFSKVKSSDKTIATTGDYAHAATTGSDAHAATTGVRAHAATTGVRAHAATTGSDAHAATTGVRAHAATTGVRAHAATTGVRAHAATTGRNAIACSLGINGRAQVRQGWLVIANWTWTGGGWQLKEVVSVNAGQTVRGVTIKPDHWYWFENDILKEEKGTQVNG